MRIKETCTFKTEQEALDFVAHIRAYHESPASEVYISGPRFVDISEVFKNMKWAQEGKEDHWSVSYEVFK